MTRIKTTILAAALLGPILAGCAATAPAAPAGVAGTTKGPALVNAQGMTLYTTDRDAVPGKSSCNGPCAQNWPPFAAAADAAPAADWTVVARYDGSRQWADRGKPLYAWSKDGKPGDTAGDGFNAVWHIARP